MSLSAYLCIYEKASSPFFWGILCAFLFLDRLLCSQLTNHLCYFRASWHGGSCDVHAGLPNHCQPRPCWLEALQLGLRLVLLVWLHTSYSKTQTLYHLLFKGGWSKKNIYLTLRDLDSCQRLKIAFVLKCLITFEPLILSIGFKTLCNAFLSFSELSQVLLELQGFIGEHD